MTRIAFRLAAAACLAPFLLASPAPATAQDPAEVNREVVTVKVDNDRVRVLDAVLRPGQKEARHSHPASVVYVVSGGKLRSHNADGTVVDTVLGSDEVFYRRPLTHWAENVGDTTIHVVVVELKAEPTESPRGAPPR